MEFVNKEYFFLLALIIPHLLWYWKKRKHRVSSLRFSDVSRFHSIPKTLRSRTIWLPQFFRILSFIFLVCVLARPRSHMSWVERSVEGIDIMLAMDVSTSMLAQDLSPNRIEAAKSVATEFISGRPNDNIGLTIFAGEAFTQCPLTLDHKSLVNLLREVRTDIAARGFIEDGTAVGMGLTNALSRLENSKAKSKVVILLTDGSNNCGEVSPLTAADIAKSLGIRVYTIGVGSNNVASYPMSVGGVVQNVKIAVEIDETSLRNIADNTAGAYYRATNTKELQKIYQDIDRLEKTHFQSQQFSKYHEAYLPFAFLGLLSLLIAFLLDLTVYKRLP